jgi:hypothetical protein
MPLGSAPAPPCPCPEMDTPAQPPAGTTDDAPLGPRPAGARWIVRRPPSSARSSSQRLLSPTSTVGVAQTDIPAFCPQTVGVSCNRSTFSAANWSIPLALGFSIRRFPQMSTGCCGRNPDGPRRWSTEASGIATRIESGWGLWLPSPEAARVRVARDIVSSGEVGWSTERLVHRSEPIDSRPGDSRPPDERALSIAVRRCWPQYERRTLIAWQRTRRASGSPKS